MPELNKVYQVSIVAVEKVERIIVMADKFPFLNQEKMLRIAISVILILQLSLLFTSIGYGQNNQQWKVGLQLKRDPGQITLTSNTNDTDLFYNYFEDVCFPGEKFAQGFETKDLLILSPDGTLSGNCQDSYEANDSKLDEKGSLSGTLDFKTGQLSFSGTSDFIKDVEKPEKWHEETHLEYHATVPSVTTDPLLNANGTITFTYHVKCINCGGETDYAGNFTFWMDFLCDPCKSSGPVLNLDSQQAARFSAILVTGSGFKPKSTLRITMEGETLYDLDTLPDGTIPKDTWIWVPDDAKFGDNQVWAEEVGTGVKSNQVTLTVTPISKEKLLENFDNVVGQYLETIPKNERWHGMLRSGSVRNIANAGQTVVAANLWLATTVFTLGHYQADLWPDNKYVCSWYQAEVLQFLNKLRFDPNPEKRALLDGLDYGPFNSGPVDLPPASHFYAVVWPHAAALDPAITQGGFNPTWENAGIAFDPWPDQKPEIYELSNGTAGWAELSAYASHWKNKSHLYTFARPEPRSFDYNWGDYPITGGSYYNPKGKGTLAGDYRKLLGIGNEPPKMIAAHSPVVLGFTDAQGNQAGIDANGELFDNIPGAEILVMPKPEGGIEWYVALPAGQVNITVTGTGEGTYQLVEKNAGGPVLEYPAMPVKTGETAQLILDDQTSPKPLVTSAGQKYYPKSKSGAQSGSGLPTLSLPLILILAGGLFCGLTGLVIAAAGVFVWRRRRKRQPPSVTVPSSKTIKPPLLRLVLGRDTVDRPWIDVPAEGIIIGRDVMNGLSVKDPLVSRQHARLEFVNGAWMLSDLNSSNGTYVNGIRSLRQVIKNRDCIQVGQTVIVAEL